MSDQHKPEISKCPPVKVDANGNWVPLTDNHPQVSHCPAPKPHVEKPKIADCKDPLPDYLKKKD